MALKEHDFVEIDYIGRAAHGVVFDTTFESVAKEYNLKLKTAYKPIIICIGEQQVLKGIDKSLVGKEVGKKYTLTLAPEEAFGKKDAKMIRLVPLRTFHKQKVQPQPGLQVDIDGTVATVLRISGGRVLVDFNHPLAGKEVMYEVDIKRHVTDKAEQIKSFMKLIFPIDMDISVEHNKAVIKGPQLPKEATDAITKKISELTQVAVEFKADEKAIAENSPEGHEHGHAHQQ